MERLLFQKNINLEYPLQELVSINVKECLNYSTDDKGKRAVGTLNVEGDYLYKKQKYHFEDMIEIDILAPFERLSETEDFYVEIDDYDYHVSFGQLSLDIHINAYGVLKKEDRYIVVDDEQERYEEIKAVMQQDEVIDVVMENTKSKEEILNTQGYQTDDLFICPKESDDELFDDDYEVYPFYICKKEDDYQSIAEKLKVEEEMLRALNDNREIDESCIIRLKKQ